jgi:DNA adenine methylase
MAAKLPTNVSAPDLDSLRLQLGDAVFEARVAEARGREEILTRLEAAIAGGVGFREAVRGLGVPTSVATFERWLRRWRSFGLAGLVDRRSGPPRVSVRATRDSAAGHAQLALAGMSEGPPVPRPPLRRGGRRAGLPSPLLKWSGSKMPIVTHLASLAPARFERYHEPFVGGGALFFALRPERAFLGDLNAELVNLYQVVRDAPDALVEAMAAHENTREHYHRVRGLDPDALPPVERAARTLFLNRTCYNGLYRVNRHGLFNVPYGSQSRTSFFQPTIVRAAHRALRGAEIFCEDFEACAGRARPGDFVYLDPPYAASLNEGKAFDYQADGFGEDDQRRVAELFRLLDRHGCLVMASNADCQLTRELYAGFEIDARSVTRRIGGRQERRGRAAEIVVRNYTGLRGVLPGV